MRDNMGECKTHKPKDDDYESVELLDVLPPRFRQISANSRALERFNFINEDLISSRIIPALHSRLRPFIPNARPGAIANSLRDLVDSAPPSPKKYCSLLFRVIEKFPDQSYTKFVYCAIRDLRLSPFPNCKDGCQLYRTGG